MATGLVFMPLLQSWDGKILRFQLLLIPRGNPLAPLVFGSPAFPSASFHFAVHLRLGNDALPTLGGSPFATLAFPPVPTALRVLQGLAQEFNIDPSPPPVAPLSSDLQVNKHLPQSYQDAVNFAPGRSKLVFTDDTYACAMKMAPAKPRTLAPPNPLIPWGKVIAIILRDPTIAAAAGLIRTLQISISPPDVFKTGGFLYVTLAPSSDAVDLLMQPDGVKIYATRIPQLSGTESRALFSPVVFPVGSTPPTLIYDRIFEEVDNYDDGWAKTVHCTQSQQLNPLNEIPDGSRPATESGIRIGWDDEQVTIWVNRQLDVTQAPQDTPIGVFGYRVDARIAGTAVWNTLVRCKGRVVVGPVDLGQVDIERGIEIHPVQLDAQTTGRFWLPSYFTAWSGASLIGLDDIKVLLTGGPDRRGETRLKGTIPSIALRYGRNFEFRVRLMDHTGGGPKSNERPVNPAPNPVGSCAFRRWIRPLEPILIGTLPTTPDPSNPPSTLQLRRPRLAYPAVVCTGYYPNVIDLLLDDMQDARASNRSPGLPDPDVDRVQIIVEVEGLVRDPTATDGTFVLLFTTTRPFPGDVSQSVKIAIEWIDISDVSQLSHDTLSGPLVLPTARSVRLRIGSECRDDPTLLYFGADDVRFGDTIVVSVRKHSSNESNLFLSDLVTSRFKALFMQPGRPIDDVTLAAQRLAGKVNQLLVDTPSRVASTLGLRNDGWTIRGPLGKRVTFGCSSSLRHSLGPDLASITFSTNTDLELHWIMVVQLRLNRDWSWDALVSGGIIVMRDGQEVGRFSPNRSVSAEVFASSPDRRQTLLVFFDGIDPKPSEGTFPQELFPRYSISCIFQGSPTTDPPIELDVIRLPVTTPPSQVPRITSTGIAFSPYQRTPDYSQTTQRQRLLWVEFSAPPTDPRDCYFARSLSNAPDPLILDPQYLDPPILESPEPPLPIDDEMLRVIVQNQTPDEGGLDAMQQLIPSESPLHWGVPLPPGLTPDSPQLFGMYKYEFRVGHHDVRPGQKDIWSTAQGRFGAPLQVTGVQHPAPQLQFNVIQTKESIQVSAPFAVAVRDGAQISSPFPNTRLWALLYAQAQQLDGTDRRNILISKAKANWDEKENPSKFGRATFGKSTILDQLALLGFSSGAPLSVLVVELLAQEVEPSDPVGCNLGGQRILRTSTLMLVPSICG